MVRHPYAGMASAWLIGAEIRELRRSLELVEAAIDALRSYAKIKDAAARRHSVLTRRRHPAKPHG